MKRKDSMYQPLLVCFLVVGSLGSLRGQEADSLKGPDDRGKTPSHALRFLGSSSSEDLEFCAESLGSYVVDHPQSHSSRYALALTLFRLQRYDEVLQHLKVLSADYASLPGELRGWVGVLELQLAVVQEDAIPANRLFQQLTEAATRESVQANDRRRFASTLGTLVGLLEPDASQTPIDRALILKTKSILSHLPTTVVEQSFKVAYKSAAERATRLEDLLELHQAEGVEGIEKELQRVQREIAAIQGETAEQKSNVADFREATNDAAKSVRMEKKRVDGELKSVIAQQKTQTSGYPGPLPPIPRRPTLGDVPVNEFETRIRIDEKTGRQETVLVRRSPFEIERERSFQFQFMLRDFEHLSQLRQAHQARLTEWENRDRARRAELAEARLKLDEQSRALGNELDRLSDESKQTAVGLKDLMTEQKVLERDLEIVQDFLNAAGAGSPSKAFRPLRIAPDEIESQRSKLIKMISQ